MPEKRVRPLQLEEHRRVIDYFHGADDSALELMGASRDKFPSPEEWFERLTTEFKAAPRDKQFCYVGWEFDGELIGHSNINNLHYGNWSNIHLHMWRPDNRERGLGAWFFVQSVNYFLEAFELQKIVCEPRAENPAPNRLLQKIGLKPVRTYRTVPGAFNFEQNVTRYEILRPLSV